MSKETFPDESWIETDESTGNRTVFGSMAHKEYFKRLHDEKIFDSTPVAIMSACRDVDGTRKAELIRKINTNPLTVETFGKYGWEVWTADEPDTVVRFASEEKARKFYQAACLHGTNGMASAKELLELSKA